MSGSTKWTVERAMAEPPPRLHPLGGCDLNTLLAHLQLNSGFSTRTRTQRILSCAAVGAREFFTIIEKLRWTDRLENYELPQPPTFIVGHWRSGTTHLHNLLSKDPQFRFIDFGQTAMPHNILGNNVNLARKIIASVLPKKRGYDNVELTIDSPQEEEMALGSLSPLGYYTVYYFPQSMKRHFDRTVFFEGVTPGEIEDFRQAYRTLVKKLSIAYEGRPLLFKNPPSTARLTLLKQLFPKARFIYIHRNPFEVFASSLNRYYRLMQAFAWQEFSDVDFEEMVFYKYRRLLGAYLEQRKKIPGHEIVETSYDAVTERPMEEIGRLYDALRIPGKEEALQAIGPYAESKRDYQRNVHHLKRQIYERILDEWKFSLEEWPHELPGHIQLVD